MHYQYDKRYNPIGQKGCYFVSLGVYAESFMGLTLSDEEVLKAWAYCVHEETMDTECFISDPAEVLNEFFRRGSSDLEAEYIGWWNKDTGAEFWNNNTSEDIGFEILRVSTPWGYHFKTPGFNPYPELEQGTEINGRRYFKLAR